MAWVAAAVVGGSVIGSVIQGNAAKDAANTQANAARDANGVQLQIYNQNRADSEPYRQAGVSALDRLMGRNQGYTSNEEKKKPLEERLKGIKAGQAHWSGLVNSGGGFGGMKSTWQANLDSHNADAADVQKQIDDLSQLNSQVQKTPQEIGADIMGQDPGYAFRLAEGNKAINAAAAARGNAVSGGALKQLSRYGQDYASNEYGNAYNRLAAMAGIGQTTNAQNANSGMNYANQAGQNITGAGNALAAGQIGQGNALNQGLGNGINSWMQYNMMNKMFPGT